jgi:hypothetical protein
MNPVFDQIQKYLNNELDRSERASFEAELNTNSALKKLVQWNKIADILLEKSVLKIARQEDKTTHELRQKMKHWQPQAKVFSIYTFIKIAAIVIPIAFMIWWLVPKEPKHIALFEKYYHAPMLSSTLGSGTESQSNWEMAKKQFEQGKYNKQLENTLSSLIQNPNFAHKQEAIFRRAIVVLHTEKAPTTAVADLKSIENPLLKEQAEWYLALAYLKNNELGAAQRLLESIVSNEQHAAFEDKNNHPKQLLDAIRAMSQ